MKVTPTELRDVLVLDGTVFHDDRGFFVDLYHQEALARAGVRDAFVQDSISFSRSGVLRGLHLQAGQAKLVRAITGRVVDVAVDLRVESPTYRQWMAVELNEREPRSIYIPPGFAHGFYVLSDAHVHYKRSTHYDPQLERGIRWNDPALGISWPSANPILSPRDQTLPLLDQLVADGVGELGHPRKCQ